MPSTTLLEIPPEEQDPMRAILRRARYGSLLACHVLLQCAEGRTLRKVPPACCARAPACPVACRRSETGASASGSAQTVSAPSLCRPRS